MGGHKRFYKMVENTRNGERVQKRRRNGKFLKGKKPFKKPFFNGKNYQKI